MLMVLVSRLQALSVVQSLWMSSFVCGSPLNALGHVKVVLSRPSLIAGHLSEARLERPLYLPAAPCCIAFPDSLSGLLAGLVIGVYEDIESVSQSHE